LNKGVSHEAINTSRAEAGGKTGKAATVYQLQGSALSELNCFGGLKSRPILLPTHFGAAYGGE
jgi:hypothetical protein